MPEKLEKDKEITPGILDTVSLSQQSATLRSFNPQSFINEYLQKLKPRERQVLLGRFGLEDGKPQTLESIGKSLNLTRERVRQIEKESLKKLNQFPLPPNFSQGVELIFKIIEEHGNLARETKILDSILQTHNTDVNRCGILFILSLIPRFNLLKENDLYHQSWYVSGFDQDLLERVISIAGKVLNNTGKPLDKTELCEKIRSEAKTPEIISLSEEILESYISISKMIDKNPFEQWGLVKWTEIRPKDVGDKAFLVLLNHAKPEHYEKITELVNKQGFDRRLAHKETVHNELIRDQRFVLVGRGIYALKKWGYQPGVVSEIIQEILRKAGRPLGRNEIIEEVLKQRIVKKNTIIVGLANRKLFQKTQDNKYTNV